MAVITPQPPYTPTNEVYVCAGIGFDNTYQNFRRFDSLDARLDYFRSKSIQRTQAIKPVRLSDAVIYLENPADFFYHADYIVFRNTDFDGGRWYFAFITQVDFVAEKTSRIHFEIDVLQTWFDDSIFTPCFVERQHWATDEPGDNLVQDNLELGEYVVNDYEQTNLFDTYSIIVAATVNKSGTPSSGGYYGGVYSGLNLLQFNSVTEVNDFLTQMVTDNKASAIVSIFMMPREFYKPVSTDINSLPITKVYNYDAPKRDTVDGYTPTNKKLLTYPYKFLQASNLSGNSADYRYEFMSIGPTFEIIGDCSPNPTVKMAPVGYNGYGSSSYAYDYGLTLNGFPQCAWTTDAYLAWLAQSGSVSALGMSFSGVDIGFAQQGLGAVGNLLSGNIGGALNSFLGIAQNVAQINATKALPPQAQGQTANGAMVAFRAKDFLFSDMSIRREFAQIIDGYWTKYGYPCHELRSLSFTSRPYWNFIKTQGCNTRGTAPQWARARIQSIFDAGITIWHTDDIGNYYLDNRPTP